MTYALLALLLLCTPPVAVKASAVKSDAPHRKATVSIPKEVAEYAPVVIKAEGFTAAVQGSIKVTPEPVWRSDLPPTLIPGVDKDGKPVVDKDGSPLFKSVPQAGATFGGKPGKYHVRALLIDFDAKTYADAEGDVVILGPVAPPEPTPDDPIPDPQPTDADFKEFQSTFESDTVPSGDKQIVALDLASYYRKAAVISKKQPAGNYGDYWRAVKAVDPPNLVGIVKVRTLIGKDLDKTMPPAAPSATITRKQLDELCVKFAKWAKYLEAMSK